MAVVKAPENKFSQFGVQTLGAEGPETNPRACLTGRLLTVQKATAEFRPSCTLHVHFSFSFGHFAPIALLFHWLLP